MSKRSAPKNCYWRGPVLWGRIEVAGKEYKWSLRTGDAKVARRRVKAELERLVAERHFGEQRHRYETVVSGWATAIASEISATTATRYAVSLGQLEPELLPLFIDEIDKAKIQEIVKRRRAEGVTTATIRRDLTALSSVLAYAEDHDMREGNPALSVLKKLTERRDPIVLPVPAYVERVAKRAKGNMPHMIRAAMLTGCRQSELVNAERVNFDSARRQLRIRGKGNKSRTIDLSPAAYAVFKAIPVALGCKYLFWHSGGEPYRSLATNFRRLVKAEMKAAQKTAQQNEQKEPDFRAFRFHDLRHLFAVDWLKAGKSIYDLQKHLGHTTITTTEMYLEFLTPDELRAVKGAPSQSTAQDERFEKPKRA